MLAGPMADIGDDTDERRRNAVALLDADLHDGLLQTKGVAILYQARLSVQRVRSISRLSSVADDRASLRTFCNTSLNMHLQNDVVDIATVVDAWESAKTRMEVRRKAEAEASLAQIPKAFNKVEIHDMANRFETLYNYRLEDRIMPPAGTLELVFDQIENGELKNMTLSQFVCREDAESEMIGAVIEKGTGAIKVKKGYGECPAPKSPEELRKRLAVVAHSYLLAQIKYPQKAILRDLRPQHFHKYMDLLLAEHVLGLKARDPEGNVVASPEFSLVLSYDYQIRRQMVKLANEGTELHEALKQAMTDTVVKERYFNNQVAQRPEYAKRTRSPEENAEWNRNSYLKGKGKGKKGPGSFAKGGGKKGKGRQMHDRTPDGRQICWKWNAPHERCRFACGRLHVCQHCFGQHPARGCPGLGKDTAGEGDKKEK